MFAILNVFNWAFIRIILNIVYCQLLHEYLTVKNDEYVFYNSENMIYNQVPWDITSRRFLCFFPTHEMTQFTFFLNPNVFCNLENFAEAEMFV